MPGYGERLKKARQRRGLTLEEVSQELNIKSSDLYALEEEDLAAMQDREFALAVLDAYAKYSDLPADELKNQLNEDWSGSGAFKAFIQKTFSSSPSTPGCSPRKRPTAITAVILLLFVAVLAVSWDSDPEPSASPPDSSEPQVQTGEDGQEAQEEPQDTTASLTEGQEEQSDGQVSEQVIGVPQDSVQVEIGTPRGDCWIEVTVDGVRSMYRLVSQGEKGLVFAGETVAVLFGNAAAVDVAVNGESVGELGQPQEIVKRVFSSGKN